MTKIHSCLLNTCPSCRPCFKPALQGCLALAKLSSRAHDGLQLSEEDAAAMATGLLEVNVRGLVVADRLLCLELLILLYQVRLCADCKE